MKKIKCENIIKEKEVSISNKAQEALIKGIKNCKSKNISLFSKSVNKIDNLDNIRLIKNELGITNTTSDVCLLDGKGLLLLIMRLPVAPEYILVKIGLSIYWVPSFVGLIRRLVKKQLKISGITSIGDKRKSLWLVLERPDQFLYKETTFYISVDKVQSFLDWAKSNRISYCVLRHYNKLPNIRKGGDLDILIKDTDKDKACSFLEELSSLTLKKGDLVEGFFIDVLFSEGKDVNGQLPYYPPYLADQIINSAIDGPANSRIPAPKEAFLSFVYHCLYHESCGYKSGIKSNLPYATVENNPRNDYSDIIRKMANDIGITIDIDMESLDEYLSQEGWRPPLDTLAIIARYNLWVQHRFFSNTQEGDLDLGVIILKKKGTRQEGLLESIVKIIKKNKFLVLAIKEFSPEEQEFMAKKLRGGNWGGGDDTLPAAAVVILDEKPSQKTREIKFVKPNRTRKLKLKIRRLFDAGGESIIHATDTTLEAEEYIDIAFSKEKEEIRRKIEELKKK